MDTTEQTIQIDGLGVHPGTLPVPELIAWLNDVYEAVMATASGDGLTLDERVPSIALAGIEDNCVSLRMAVAMVLLPYFSTVSHSIHEKDPSRLPMPAQKAVARLVDRVEKTQHTVRIVENRAHAIPEAIIAPADTTAFTFAPATLVSGQTTVYGRCVSVGGAVKPRAIIALTAGGNLTVYGTEVHIKALAQLLYEDVMIEGTAVWVMPEWDMRELSITRVDAHPYLPPTQAIAQLRTVTPGLWDDVNPDEYVNELRYGA